MILIKEINLIIENIPTLLQYFIPGYWTITVFSFFTSKKISLKIINIMACVISYILISLISILRIKLEFLNAIPDVSLGNSAIAFIFGTGLAVFFAIIFCSQTFSKLTTFLFHKTPHDTIWRDVLDLRHGSNVKVYLKNKKYYLIGHYKNLEENINDPWMSISAFAKYDKKSNLPLKKEPSHLEDEQAILTVRLSEIEYLEIFN